MVTRYRPVSPSAPWWQGLGVRIEADQAGWLTPPNATIEAAMIESGCRPESALSAPGGSLNAISAAALSAGGAYSGPTGKLPKTYAAFKRVVQGLGDAFIALAGDSTTLSAGAGDTTPVSVINSLTGAGSARYAAQLAAYLTSVGIPAADNSFFGEGLIQAFQGTNYSAYDSRFATIGSASYYPNGQQESAGGILWRLNSSGQGLSYTPQIGGANSSYDRVKVIYCNRTTGSFTVSQPGGGSTAQTITTTAAATTIGITTVSLTRGSGVCNLSWASGDNWIIGAIFYDSKRPRVNVLTLGHYGEKITSATGPALNTNEWRAGAVIAALALDAVVWDMAINSINNDGVAGIPAYLSGTTTIFNDIVNSGADLIAPTPHQIGTAAQGVVSDAYVSAIKNLAATYSAPVFDAYNILTYSAYSSTLYYDTLHPNSGGYHSKAQSLCRFLRATCGY